MSSFSRQLVWIFVAVVIAQSGVFAAQTVLPVATNIAGSVAVQTANGSEEVSSTRILRSGEAVITGVDSSAIVSLADVARVMLGSGTTLTTFSDGTTLSLQLVSGELCVQSSRPRVTVVAGSLSLLPTDPSTIYDLSYAQNRTELLVYRGSVATKVNGASPTIVKAGTAAAILNSGAPRPADVSTVNADFNALHCPDPSIVAQVIPGEANAGTTSSAHGGSFAGILGVLAGLGAIAAAAGHGGGGGSTATTPPTTSGSPTPVPSPSILPTETPAPTPTPSTSGNLSLSPTNLSFSAPLSPSQNFVARDHDTRSFSANSSDLLVAVVVEKDVHGHSATFLVSPVGPGTAMISVSDGADNSGTVSISVGVGLSSAARQPQAAFGQLVVLPKELVLGVGNRATFLVSEAHYTGPFRVISSGPSAAEAVPTLSVGPSASFTMIGRSPGIASLTITDNHGETATLQISVRPH